MTVMTLISERARHDVREVTGDPRVLLAAGYALVLQVAHPSVAAGVNDHSAFMLDPWQRLLRTLDFLAVMTCGSFATCAQNGLGNSKRNASVLA